MKDFINKQRIFDYLDGKVTALEVRQIEEWVNVPENGEFFYLWLCEWEQDRLQFTPKQEEGLRKYREFLHKSGSTADTSGLASQALPKMSEKETRRNITFRWGWAAAIVLLTLFSFSLYQKLSVRDYVTGFGETRSVLLQDGSSVVLGANTSLKVPRFGFGSKSRVVTLQGEALFSVVHKKEDQKFIVKTLNAAEVVVLGTEFSVFARSRGTRVKLNRGKVEVRYQNEHREVAQVVLSPGDQMTLSPDGELVRDEMQKAETSGSWVARQFRFEKTPLSEILQMLAENYDLTVNLEDPELAVLSLTGTYEASRGEELLQTVAEVLDLELKQEKNKYKLVSRPD